MTNAEAIQSMDIDVLESILDQIYLTGLNAGLYAATLPIDSEEHTHLLGNNPFDLAWLNAPAEEAMHTPFAQDGDMNMLNALCIATLRQAGIEWTPEDPSRPN